MAKEKDEIVEMIDPPGNGCFTRWKAVKSIIRYRTYAQRD